MKMKALMGLVCTLVCLPRIPAGEGKEAWIFPPPSYSLHIDEFQKDFDFSITARNIQYFGTRADESSYPFISADENHIYLRDGLPNGRIQISEIQRESDGFQTFSDGTERWPIILGGGYCVVTHRYYNDFDGRFKELHEAREQMLSGRLEERLLHNLGDVTFILPQVIKGVRMSAPFLGETIGGVRYRYDDDMLLYRWFYGVGLRIGEMVNMRFINDPTPMVEGVPGNGVGQTLDIDYHIPSDNLVVLNGFVDLDRRHLYKRNARMKKVLVQGDGFELEYEFQDYVHFAQIDFPKKVQQVRLTVLEVYDGSHHEDLSISGLFTNPDILNTRNSPLAFELLGEAKMDRLYYRYYRDDQARGVTPVQTQPLKTTTQKNVGTSEEPTVGAGEPTQEKDDAPKVREEKLIVTPLTIGAVVGGIAIAAAVVVVVILFRKRRKIAQM